MLTLLILVLQGGCTTIRLLLVWFHLRVEVSNARYQKCVWNKFLLDKCFHGFINSDTRVRQYRLVTNCKFFQDSTKGRPGPLPPKNSQVSPDTIQRYLGAFTNPFSKESRIRIYRNMNTNKGNRIWILQVYNNYNYNKGPINNPLDLHPNALKAWFYKISFWAVGKNDMYKMITDFLGKVPYS